ncbi:S-adenosyl-L-methionine-dependent methyltransferase [Clohesyomyces aquaticus]|uniref:S-adenosyl-L-methionine-dependent methyltransferase n=1 Tax=Clohesyomyces aquaticus TaxID=1231657 RepID=A0A1Y1ZYL0_9PLEO|nr:S-adenosyl-L-methionine-dependent methyltransferase [Clohesyomyces aquaticus]
MAPPSGFIPKQAKPLLEGRNKVTTYEATGDPVTSQFASHNLTLIPAIPPNSIIHDNACGSGTVSKLLLSQTPPLTNLTIHATDIDQVFLDTLSASIQTHSWPITTSNQKSESLSFPDNFFTHSITNIGIIFCTSAGLDGAKEIYRTLQPGGLAIVNCWEHITWFLPIMMVSKTLRPGTPPPPPVVNWNDGTQLKKVMLEAGFEEGKMRVEKSEAWAKTRDVRRWAELAWAFLGGMAGWRESDEERWEEGIDMLEKLLKGSEGTKVVDGETWMRASQWVVVAEK